MNVTSIKNRRSWALHHVMIRGIERTEIFQDDKDRDSFLDRFGGILLESSTSCYAWSLLSNHAHFLRNEAIEEFLLESQ